MINSAATSHFCPDRSRFKNYTPITPIPVYAADGRSFEVVGRGDVETHLPNGRHCIQDPDSRSPASPDPAAKCG
ncbi:hypothetical protein B0H17DRAFT_934077 [Mycena rosella]|uniref:Retrovirus-related Pol polyprotein from transposon TNT 1-94-like beta-barrel domain-containing protein n=1 Tax=Mycena rosella TaxID=1033263 RepID=A0AAD7DJ23_MYCRO|nr:hypothetical protein B0H17DRAFT_934077 [Mycena rosella]